MKFILLCFLSLPFITQAQWIQQTLPDNSGVLLTIDVYENTGVSGGWKFNFDPVALIFYSDDAGKNWHSSTYPFNVRAIIYNKLFNETTGIAAASYNRTLKSKAVSSLAVKNLLVSKNFKEREKAIMGIIDSSDTGAMILKTSDGGISWNPIYSFPDSITYLTGGFFINEDVGFVSVISNYPEHYIYKTTDGGETWSHKLNISSFGRTPILFINEMFGMVGGYEGESSGTTVANGLIAVTKDGGESWEYRSLQEIELVNSLTYSNEFIFYASGQLFETGSVYKSVDAGLSWQKTIALNNYFLEGVNFLTGTNSGVVYGTTLDTINAPFIAFTKDGGNTISRKDVFHELKFPVGDVQIIDNENIFACGGFYPPFIIFNSSAGLTSVENELSLEGFLLQQNYPNPFNPSTTIKFTVPASASGWLVTLKIFDLLGSEIAVLVNEVKSPGEYEAVFKVSSGSRSLPSGVYFYTLNAGEFMESKKLILLR